MQNVSEALIRSPRLILFVVAALTLFFATRIISPNTGELQLRIDPSFDALLPDTAPERIAYDWSREEFGDDQSLILSLVLDDVFTVDHLQLIQNISDELEEAPGVDYVTSLATADHISSEAGSIDTRAFLDPLPTTQAEAERIREEVHGNPVYAGNLVSADSTAAAFVVYVDDTPETVFTDEQLDMKMLALVEAASGEAPVFLSGTAHMRSATSRILRSDLAFMLPVVVAIMAFIALLSFRSPRGVAVPLLTILLATLWTLGLMAWTGITLNLVTTILPVLLLTVGFAYSVHIIAEYQQALRHNASPSPSPATRPAAHALEHVWLPVVLTCLTTVAGFLSLTISAFPAVREFGWVSVFGVVATTLLTLTLSPALLEILGPPKPRREHPDAESAPQRFESWVRTVGRFCIDHRRAFLVGAALFCVLTAWGVTRIRVDTHLITNFDVTHPVRTHFGAINDQLEGARPFSVVLKAGEEEAFLDPTNLRAVDELTTWLAQQPEIGGATSFADYVRLLNRAFHEDDPAELEIPDSAMLIKQYLLFGETDELDDYVASNYQNTLIKVRSKSETTREIADLIDRIERRFETLPPGIEANVTGNTVVLAQSLDAIAEGQVQSLTVATIFIFLILAVLFASLRMGFFALIPNVLPVLLFFGLLGLTGVPLNATTGLIACVVLGIAVDDTIHFMTRFNTEARLAADEKVGALRALTGLARPVTITTVGLCLGFLVFTTGALRNQAEFGALAAIVLAFAWMVDVTFTPALCSGLKVVTLWDVLTFDLGEDPHKTIPLFRGLSKTQARVTALVTQVVSFSAGEPIFKTGEAGDALYVVIDGELDVALDVDNPQPPGDSESGTHPNGQRRLQSAQRGELVGEIGLYHGRRTANVTALTEARLLRLDADNLARLRKRNPRIGAQILWNLSEIMAGRFATATERERALAGRLAELETPTRPSIS